MRSKPALLALIAAIATSLCLLLDDMRMAATACSALTTLFAAWALRQERLAGLVPVTDKSKSMQLIDELNDRLNSRKQEAQTLQNRIQTLEASAKLAAAAKLDDSDEAAVLMFLRVLQEKSRLLDFALTDITRLPDAQVGGAARVVHQGLRTVLQDSFEIAPIAAENEGQTLQLPDDFDSSRYRILQQTAVAQTPAGVVLHRGWEVKKTNLPRSLRRAGDPLPSVLAPVEIEAREVRT